MTRKLDKCSGCPRQAEGGGGECSGCRREPRGKLLATNWLEDVSSVDDYDVVEVMFKNTRVGFYSNPSHLDLKIGDVVAVEASPGHDIGRVTMVGRLVALQMKKAGVKPDSEFKKVFRLARQSDLEKFEEARAREHETMIRSRKIAEDLQLNMKIGDVEYQGDGGKAIFYNIADERVDFRKLIRILADTFKVRIEMKQIGARQEAGRIGGIGPCGRPLCCSSWMTHFVSVGTGAARVQDLSMNPLKLAGQCAKLKCCLNFEAPAYAEASRQLPARDITLETKDATYYYFKPDILARKVTYSTDRNIPANLVTIDASRAFEIIALNKQGIKVDALLEEGEEEVQREYVDLVGQESLTRFDRSKKRKKKKGGGKQQGASSDKSAEKQPRNEKEQGRKGEHRQQGNGGKSQSNGGKQQHGSGKQQNGGKPQQSGQPSRQGEKKQQSAPHAVGQKQQPARQGGDQPRNKQRRKQRPQRPSENKE